MSSVDFISSRKIEKQRSDLREARESILAKAKDKYDTAHERDMKAMRSGEKQWLLSSINDKIEGSNKRKKSKHSKKKSKKMKKQYSSDSDSSSSEEEMWVEKKPAQPLQSKEETIEQPIERENWMQISSAFKTYTRDELRLKEGTSRVLKTQEERRKKLEGDKPGSHPLELNPFYKKEGEGLPRDSPSQAASTYDAEWLKKALVRAKEQAKAEGKSLEEVASKRWGSLEKFNELLAAAEKNTQNLWSSGSTSSGRDGRRDHRRIRGTEGRYNSRTEFRRDRSRSPRRSSMQKPNFNDDQSGQQKSRPQNTTSDPRRTMETHRRSWRKEESTENSRSSFKRPLEEDHVFMPQADYRNMSRADCHKVIKSSQQRTTLSEPTEPVKIVSPQCESEISKPVLNDQEMNKLAAKLTKAELLGNDSLVEKLKKKLEDAREARKAAEDGGLVDSKGASIKKEEEVYLTRTLDSGLTLPVDYQSGKVVKKKKYSKALVEFEERYNIKEMFEAEKKTSASEQIEMAEMAALKMGATNDDDFDDDAGNLQMVNRESLAMKSKQQARAIREHQVTERTLESCNRCLGNTEMQKHLMLSLGKKCYLSVPPGESLSEGQCCIVPIHHVQSSLLADEDLWEEITAYKSALVKMYAAKDEDCVFFETYIRQKNSIPHLVLHAVPLPKEMGDLAPIYFKKAIDECEAEWAQNKKLVKLQERGGIRRAVPKGLSYFYVDFGMSPGYAHVIEDEHTFPKNFAQEIVGGMLDSDSSLWRKPPKLSFDAQRQKVLKFAKEFKSFDPTL